MLSKKVILKTIEFLEAILNKVVEGNEQEQRDMDTKNLWFINSDLDQNLIRWMLSNFKPQLWEGNC